MSRSQKKRASQRAPLELRDPRAIRSLASPVRQAIVDALEVVGPCVVRELAAYVARDADALYYHLRLLQASGIVSVDTGAGGETVVDLAGRPVTLHYEPGDRRNRAAVLAVVRSMLRSSERRFAVAYHAGQSGTSGEARTLWAGRAQGWVDEDDVRSINKHLLAILTILRRSRKGPHIGAALQEFTMVLAPLRGAQTESGSRSVT